MSLLVILLAGQALASMDGSIMAVAAPSLRADLHASGAEIQLVVAMYLIMFAALVILGARVGELIGRGRAFMLGVAGFAAASLLGGLAPDPVVLVAARALQGASGALLTPQVLALIQTEFSGPARTRAISAYSVILAVGVAAGQILGGLLIAAHLLAGAWRPALLINAPAGVLLLAGARGRLLSTRPVARRRLDLLGAALLGVALLGLVLVLTLGRQARWPAWVWPILVICGAASVAFVSVERRVKARGSDPVFDLDVLRARGVALGVLGVLVLMGCYAGFLLSLTLRLQNGLGYTALHAGLLFAVYAAGFATASVSWPRLGESLAPALPVAGPLVMALGLLVFAVTSAHARAIGLPLLVLLFAGGSGHAFGYSPLANRMTGLVVARQVTELSGLLLVGALIGQVVGVAAIAGLYLARVPAGSGQALIGACVVAAIALVGAAGAAAWTLRETARSRQQRGEVGFRA
jgi:hypothetical protein